MTLDQLGDFVRAEILASERAFERRERLLARRGQEVGLMERDMGEYRLACLRALLSRLVSP